MLNSFMYVLMMRCMFNRKLQMFLVTINDKKIDKLRKANAAMQALPHSVVLNVSYREKPNLNVPSFFHPIFTYG